MLVTKQPLVAIDFHRGKKNTMEINGYQQLFGYQHSKVICTGLEQQEGE